MIAEIDERELERLLQLAADAVEVPDDGPADVLRAARSELPRRLQAPSSGDTPPPRRDGRIWMQSLAAAAAIVLVVGVSIAALGHSGSSSSKADSARVPATIPDAAATRAAPAPASGATGGAVHDTGTQGGVQSGKDTDRFHAYATSPTTIPTALGSGGGGGSAPPTASTGPSDSAKIVSTGDTVLEVPKGSVDKAAGAVTAVAKGAGGYVADNKTTGGTTPSAALTIRVPARNFDDTVLQVSRLAASYHGKVLSASTHSADVTAQFTDLRARRDAAVAARDQLGIVLGHAQTVGDILAVNDRIKAVQTEIDQLTGQIHDLDDQASYSSLAVAIAEKSPAPKPAAKPEKPLTGMDKARHDAATGFSHAVEWLVARSGKAFVGLVAIIALLFLLRFLYPVIRRGLL